MSRVVISPDDVHPAERGRVARASALYEATAITDPDSAAFHEAFAVLDDYFGPKNEIETKAILQHWLNNPIVDGISARYLLLSWHTRERRRLAAVRDGFVTLDPAHRRAIALMSHSFVAEPDRRTGLSALLRAAPATMLCDAVTAAGLDPARTASLLVAEMEPLDPSDPDTVVRLLAYGRVGFRAVHPAALPYFQPDFRPAPETYKHVPLVLLVRRLDGEADTLSPDLAAAIITHLARIHARAVAPEGIAEVVDWSLGRLSGWHGEVPLLDITHPDGLVPLLSATMCQHYPAAYQRPAEPNQAAALYDCLTVLENR